MCTQLSQDYNVLLYLSEFPTSLPRTVFSVNWITRCNVFLVLETCWRHYFTEGYPHNDEAGPHLELDCRQRPFPWLDLPFLTETWRWTWDYSTLIRLPLLASPFFHQSHPPGSRGVKAVPSHSMPTASTVTLHLPARMHINYCTSL